MDQKKLLIFTDFFTPHWTGIAKSFGYLIRGISKNYKITVLTVKFDESLKRKEEIHRARVLREGFLFSVSRSKYSIKILLKLAIIARDFDMIIINSPSSNILPASIIAKVLGKRLLIFHQGDLILPKDSVINKIIEKVFDISTYISLVLADVISTYTQDYANASRVLRPFLHKFKPMLLPVYLKNSKRKIKATEDLKKRGIYVFGFAGRFVEEKGFDILFDAIPEIVKQIQNVHFVFAGETDISYEQFFVKKKQKYDSVRKYVTLLGLLNDEGMSAFYRSIDFIIIPSRSDCFNLVQAEAMLSGVPSIVSDIPGARVLVKKTGFGLVFRKENAEDLAKKIIEAIDRKEEFNLFRNRVVDILNNNKNVAKIKDIIG